MSAIDRPDWGSGGENRSMVPTSPTTDIDQGFLDNGMTRAELATIRSGEITRPDWSGDYNPADFVGHSGHKPSDAGLPAAVVDDMRNSADGYDAQLGSMQHSARLIAAEYGQGIVDHFEQLPDSLKVKAYRTMMRNPGASLPELLDRIEPSLTLDEAAEAMQWVRKLKAMAR